MLRYITPRPTTLTRLARSLIRQSSHGSHGSHGTQMSKKADAIAVKTQRVTFSDVVLMMSFIGSVSGAVMGISYGLFHGGLFYDRYHKLQRRERIVDKFLTALYYGTGGVFAGAIFGATAFGTCPLVGLAYYIDSKQQETRI